MPDYNIPAVYNEEIPQLPPSIVSVETAIPAFIGYTEKALWKDKDDLKNVPWRITSLLEYEKYFGYPDPEIESLSVVFEANGVVNARVDETKRSKFLMHYSMQLYFANGGGACWITSVGNYLSREERVDAQDLKDGLNEVGKINEVTLLVFPDSINLRTKEEYYDLHAQAIQQCVFLQDRFTVMDVYHTADNLWTSDISDLRTVLALTTDELKYAAVYFPKLYTGIDYYYKLSEDRTRDNDMLINIVGIPDVAKLSDLIKRENAQYVQAKNAVANLQMLLPASTAIVGIYAQIDSTRGVWKAPANINITYVTRTEFPVTKNQQADLNVDAVAGKSVNVIRSFTGRGPAVIWGARTLAGNDHQWRYVPVRRFINMVSESVKSATKQFVFEPNDGSTWIKLKLMAENYLSEQWRAGALMGATTRAAFFVRIGLGETMTELDLQEGRMILEIGLAVLRPAEFIILRFSHKMLNS
jgi:phage tail sheath protein FI